MRTGVHCSVRKGFVFALQQAAEVGAETVQMFSRSPRRWRTRIYDESEFREFREVREKLGLFPIVMHAPYLPNLGTSNAALHRKSIEALIEDLDHSEKLGAEFLVIHPGAYSPASDLKTGIRKIVDALNEGLAAAPGRCKILIENMAGGGRRIGGPFAQLADILRSVRNEKRMGICFDTCHATGAGYDLASERGRAEMLKEFDREVGLERIDVFHVNDSSGVCGSHRDLHEHLGKGQVGLAGLKSFFRSYDFDRCAFILETPKHPWPQADLENLKILRGFFD